MRLKVFEICAGAGGQASGLEAAGFEHVASVEIDPHACNTLRANRPRWRIIEGSVAEVDGSAFTRSWEAETPRCANRGVAKLADVRQFSEVDWSSPRSRNLFELFQESVDLGLGKGLTIGVKFRQKSGKRVRESRKNLLKFRKCDPKRPNFL